MKKSKNVSKNGLKITRRVKNIYLITLSKLLNGGPGKNSSILLKSTTLSTRCGFNLIRPPAKNNH